jgi:hypothetical protein
MNSSQRLAGRCFYRAPQAEERRAVQREAVPNRGGLDPRDWQAPTIRQPFARVEKRDSFRGTWKLRPPTLSYTLGVDAHGDGCRLRQLKRRTDGIVS